MNNLIFKNWTIIRMVRLAFAIFLFVQAYYTHEWFFIVFGLFFGFQVIFNLGCGACQMNSEIEKK
jgi:hypothetical protein